MSRPGRFPLRFAAMLCLIAASCSGDDRPTTTNASGTSSTLSTPASAAAGVGEVAGNPSLPGVAPGKPDVLGASTPKGSRSLSASTTASSQQNNTTGTTTATGTTTTTTATTVPPGLPPEKCPDPKTCRRYAFMGSKTAATAPRWPKGPDGFVTVRYYVNPTGSGLSDDQVKGAAERAFAGIMSVAPRVRIEFAGFTGRVPTPTDGFNDIGFTNASTGHALPVARDGAIIEADMLLGAAPGFWTWEPCELRDNSCTPVCVKTASGGGCRNELQAVISHEGFHWFYLADLDDYETDRQLTMFPDPPFNDRFRSTPSLGEALAVRALGYSCDGCPLPTIYAP